MYDVVALGELLIDFTPAGLSSNQCFLFEQNPGGAPANVLSVLSKFNKATGFIGKLGNDQFGHFLKGVLDDINVSTEGIVFDDEVRTTLAFVHLDENGDRKFSFYRNPGADMLLREEEINFSIIENAGDLGAPVPEFLRKALKKFRDSIDSAGDKLTDNKSG